MQAPRPYIPESVDPEAVSPSAPFRALKQFGLVLLCAAWVALGIAGHDPWKTEDATSIGVAVEMSDQNDFVVPRLGGEPYVPRPPLAYMGGALSLNLFSPPLTIHNAARLVVGVALALVLAATAFASRELNGRAFRWLPVLILVGSVGFWDRAHVLSPELFLTLGIAIGTWGIALALRRPVIGGLGLGAGIAVAFLGDGFLGPLWLVVTALLLPLCGPEWRNRAYFATVVTAFGAGIVLSLPWPLALHARDPALFAQWLASESPGDYVSFLGEGHAEPAYYLRNLVWFAWPSLPLLLWLLWLRGRGFNGGLREPGIVIPGVLSLVILANLLVMPEARLANALPLIIPFSLLAALEVDSLKRGFSGALDWFGILTFGLTALVMWVRLDRRLPERHADAGRADLSRHRIGLPALVPFGLHAGGARPDDPVGRSRASGKALEPPRDPQLGRRRHADLGTRHDHLAALPRFAPQLSLDRRSSREAVAGARLCCEPQSRRGAACALQLLRRDQTVREEIRPKHDCTALLVQYGRVDGRPRRRRDGPRSGAARAAVTTPSASCST